MKDEPVGSHADVHKTVLLDEAVSHLVWEAAGVYIDGTLGRGGHAESILAQLDSNGRLLAFDRDPQAIEAAHSKFAAEERIRVIHGAFSGLEQAVTQRNMLEKVSGILLDLGVSSPQLDQANRGFSFSHDGPLDMRMDPSDSHNQSAADWLVSAEEDEIAQVLKKYGEERFAKRIAAAIVRERAKQPIVSTLRLADIVKQANPAWEKNKHPATRVFQAIRIFINNELNELEKVLDSALRVLKPGGRLVVISFHSLEDRLVKRFIRDHAKGERIPVSVPVRDEQLNKKLKPIGKAIRASESEVKHNLRSRSAIMRVAEKL